MKPKDYTRGRMGFNEAGALTPRKHTILLINISICCCFNEAGALTPRKPGSYGNVDGLGRCFNEAGALTPRKRARYLRRAAIADMLQ